MVYVYLCAPFAIAHRRRDSAVRLARDYGFSFGVVGALAPCTWFTADPLTSPNTHLPVHGYRTYCLAAAQDRILSIGEPTAMTHEPCMYVRGRDLHRSAALGLARRFRAGEEGEGCVYVAVLYMYSM